MSGTATNDTATVDETAVLRKVGELLDTHPPDKVTAEKFLGAQFDQGLAFVHFPVGYGGLGLSRRLQAVVNHLLGQAGAPDFFLHNAIGYGMAAPTILAMGTEAQKRRYLRPLFTCEEIWCQMFSEPGAGSDVASLSTRAVKDGDEWVITGQKVWTTLAHVARFGMVLARTDPDQVKHRGLTYFVLDMRAPGVDVRPLRQMTGDAEFNEVYLTDVRVPDSERLSPVGGGWRAALVTLMNERVSIGGSVPPRESGPIGTALSLWRTKEPGERDPVTRDRLVRLWVEAEVFRLTNMRAAAQSALGTPGPEGSIAKLGFAESNQRIYEICEHLLGPDGMLYNDFRVRRPGEEPIDPSPQHSFLRSRANSIEGGTSEVMRNTLGERVLGLPGDVRVDKDLPWSQGLRS
jgi:alkylation response protein AidB-like acyl-CoA dehydrogenase